MKWKRSAGSDIIINNIILIYLFWLMVKFNYTPRAGAKFFLFTLTFMRNCIFLICKLCDFYSLLTHLACAHCILTVLRVESLLSNSFYGLFHLSLLKWCFSSLKSIYLTSLDLVIITILCRFKICTTNPNWSTGTGEWFYFSFCFTFALWDRNSHIDISIHWQFILVSVLMNSLRL